jgi:hypothetical protein
VSFPKRERSTNEKESVRDPHLNNSKEAGEKMNVPLIVAIVGVIVYGVFRMIKGFNWVAELGKFAFIVGLLAFLMKSAQ